MKTVSLYQQAKALAIRTGHVSISLIERELHCGYGVAGRLLARLVHLGVVCADTHELVKKDPPQ